MAAALMAAVGGSWPSSPSASTTARAEIARDLVFTRPPTENDEDPHASPPRRRVIHTRDDFVRIGGHDDDVGESTSDGIEIERGAARREQQTPRRPGVGQSFRRCAVDDEQIGAVQFGRGRRRVGQDDDGESASAQHVVQPVRRFGIGRRQHDSHPTYRKWVPTPAALIPVRTGPTAKRRLAHVLRADERASLVERLLEHVVEVLTGTGLRVVVLSPEPVHVEGAEVWTDQAPGLNAAVAAALDSLGTPALVVHADLPLLSADDVAVVLESDADVVVARSYDGGTNGLLLRSPIRPAFGVGSAAMHADRARRAGLRAAVLDIPGFALDVDDEAGLSASGAYPYTRP